MKNRLESVTHSVKTRHKNEGSYLATPKVLALAVSSAMTVFACPSLLHAHSVTGPVSGSGIQWETVSADGDRTIRIQFPDGTRYYQYNYTGTPAFSSRSILADTAGEERNTLFARYFKGVLALCCNKCNIFLSILSIYSRPL